MNIFTWARSFIINKITRSFIIVELYWGRSKAKMLFVFSNISISFPRSWSQYGKARRKEHEKQKKQITFFLIYHSIIRWWSFLLLYLQLNSALTNNFQNKIKLQNSIIDIKQIFFKYCLSKDLHLSETNFSYINS